jgi:hypothetical protein
MTYTSKNLLGQMSFPNLKFFITSYLNQENGLLAPATERACAQTKCIPLEVYSAHKMYCDSITPQVGSPYSMDLSSLL